MKVGIITKYNGKYGTIKTEDIEVDFEAKDISLGIDLKEGDKVIFRVEQRIRGNEAEWLFYSYSFLYYMINEENFICFVGMFCV